MRIRSPLSHAQNPAFNSSDSALRTCQVRVEKPRELAIKIGLAQPRGRRVSVIDESAEPSVNSDLG